MRTTMLLALACSLILSFKTNGEDYQLTLSKSDPNPQLTLFLQPVFSSGISRYLKDVFNAPDYVQDFLPNNFAHLIELMQHAKDTDKPKLYIKSVLRLFINRMKSSSYINAYAFHDLMMPMPGLLKDYFAVNADRAFDSLKDVINEMLLSSFVAKFPEFKANPGTFLESLSQDIEDAAELRKLLMLFLELSINKLVWNPQEYEHTWGNVKTIAEQIEKLHKNNMITDHDDVNSLYISLIERYCFFLDLTQSQLPASFYQKIKDDISSHTYGFLTMEEQERYIETKMERFTRVLMTGEAKALGREKGLLI